MANTTFSGPVRSQNGFQSITVDGTTGAVTVDATFGTATSVTSLAVSGASTLSGALIGGVQALSGAGAVNLTTPITSLTTTGAAQALTLANGTAGQIKYIVHTVDGGSAVLTPTTAIGFTTITFTAVGDAATLVYTSAGWAVVGSRGVTIA
jgi:hypothetical protein